MPKDKPYLNKHFTKIDDPLRLMSKYQENKIYLFNLDKEKSPFNENLLFLKSNPKDDTTDYFQYMYIINRGRKAEHLKM